MERKIQIKRGEKADLPTLSEAEFGWCTDTQELYIGQGDGNNVKLNTQDPADIGASPSDHDHDSQYLKLTGGKLTGDLIGESIQGSWLQSRTKENLGAAAYKICVFNDNGCIYYRTPGEILSDIGAKPATDSDVFIAEYGVTKNSEIKAAFQAGKAVFVFDGCYFAPLSDWEGDAEHIFSNSYTRMQCVNDVWSYGEDSFEPAKHAGTHKSNGSDPITPAMIGAAASKHTHSEYAPAYSYGTADLTALSSPLETGKLYFVYE